MAALQRQQHETDQQQTNAHFNKLQQKNLLQKNRLLTSKHRTIIVPRKKGNRKCETPRLSNPTRKERNRSLSPVRDQTNEKQNGRGGTKVKTRGARDETEGE